jgi:hypothetical protein
MAMKLDCPRCKHRLSVPNKMAGSYAHCPRCAGQFWVPFGGGGEGGSDAGRSPPAAPIAAPPIVSPPPAAISASAPAALRPAPPAPLPVPLPAPRRKVARMISADSPQSTVRLAADGQLPQLQFEESGKKEKAAAKSATVNPLVLSLVLLLSTALSVLLVLVDVGPTGPSNAQQKAAARRLIEDKYFGSSRLSRSELEPYQIYLREAQGAHARSDRKAERENYRKVLDLLRAESAGRERGVTGSRDRDRTLEKQIVILLNDR